MNEAERAAIRRVLIYRLGSFGDTVVALPSLHLVARLFPHAERRLLANQPVHSKAPSAAAVLENSGLITGTMSYPVGTRNPLTLAGIAFQVRRYRPNLLVYLAKPRGEAVLARDRRFFSLACGVRRIVGIPFGELGVNLPPTEPGGLWEHEAARLARSIAALGSVDLHDKRNWDLRLTAEENSAAAQALAPLGDKPLIACGPGTKMQAKDWGAPAWRALLDLLAAAHPHHGLVLVGAKDDYAVAEEVACDWGGRVVNLCGELAPRVTAAALARAALIRGPDSGHRLLAAALGVPCAIVFASRTEPGMWFPFGSGHQTVYHREPCSNCDLEVCVTNGKRCITSITPDEMFAAAERALARRA